MWSWFFLKNNYENDFTFRLELIEVK